MLFDTTKADIFIGIDSGANTGYAVWDRTKQAFITIDTVKIHEAILRVLELRQDSKSIHVRVEDARQRKWFGSKGREALQGAGSVKRDAGIWEDFLKAHSISYEMVAPKSNNTKLDRKTFKLYTKWPGVTNEHSRDAAMLVFNM